MPAPQEAGHRSEHKRVQESLVRRIEPQFREIHAGERERQRERDLGRDVRQDAEHGGPDEPARCRVDRLLRDGPTARGQVCVGGCVSSTKRCPNESSADERTFDENAIRCGIDRPDVAGPVGVIQAALERKEAGKDLAELGEPACDHKGSERDGADCDDDGAQLDDAVGFQS